MIRHFKKGDCERLLKQPHQEHKENKDYMFDSEDTIVYEDEGKVLVILRPYFELGGRCILVSYISQDCGYKAVSIFKTLKPIIDDLAKNNLRLECVTQKDFEPANRLAKMLGFSYEGTMKKYYNGIDFNMWGRV
jgi:hypothetical protein